MASPFERYVEALGLPLHATLIRASGPGGTRQPLGFWLPLAWELHLIPVNDFVFLARSRLAGIRLGQTGEELREGRGRIRAGRRVVEGDAADRAQYAALWAWTLVLAPAAALARADVFVEAAGERAARVGHPFRKETWECRATFGEHGLLTRLDTHREDVAKGGTLRFAIEVERWTTRDGRPSPERLLTRWGDVAALRLDVAERSVEV